MIERLELQLVEGELELELDEDLELEIIMDEEELDRAFQAADHAWEVMTGR